MNCGKILIVEDQPELSDVLEYQLQGRGFATLVAADGLQACRLAGSERPDLILLDLLLPDLDGWEGCRLIRSRRGEEIGSVPIVMLTARSSMDDRLRGLDLGADAYLAKPYSIREVVLTARRLIERRRRTAPRQRPFFLPAALLIGASRVFFGLHYPTDVLVGILLGTVTGFTVARLLQSFLLA